MDNFYTIVLVVAILILIIVLTYVGILMSYGEGTQSYPGTSTTCPDYWKISEDGTCMIPKDNTERNTGVIYKDGLLELDSTNTQGLDSDKKTIDFSGQSVCNKQDWANQNSIIWDGVSNYNDC
jgi:hypothetical protein